MPAHVTSALVSTVSSAIELANLRPGADVGILRSPVLTGALELAAPDEDRRLALYEDQDGVVCVDVLEGGLARVAAGSLRFDGVSSGIVAVVLAALLVEGSA